MKIYIRCLFLFVTCCLAACGDGKDFTPIEYKITDQALQGKIDGKTWTFKQGGTNAFLSEKDTYFASLYMSSSASCRQAMSKNNSLIVHIPKKKGDYDLSLSLNMTFVAKEGRDGTLNQIGTTGRLIVDDISDTKIKARIYAKAGDDYVVDGHFEVSICQK